jgi:hypothetical protein
MSWKVSGTYFEACNCEAICPCRRHGKRRGGRSTYGECDFVLSWWVKDGRFDAIDLTDCKVVLIGSYDDDEPRSPWSVALYIDDESGADQSRALSDIFLGRAGGDAFTNYGRAIADIRGVRKARIELDHTPNSERITVGTHVKVATRQPVTHQEPVSCGIPGHDHPGQEVVADVMAVDDFAFDWHVHDRCGFASDFAYSSQSPS